MWKSASFVLLSEFLCYKVHNDSLRAFSVILLCFFLSTHLWSFSILKGISPNLLTPCVPCSLPCFIPLTFVLYILIPTFWNAVIVTAGNVQDMRISGFILCVMTLFILFSAAILILFLAWLLICELMFSEDWPRSPRWLSFEVCSLTIDCFANIIEVSPHPRTLQILRLKNNIFTHC